MAVERTAGALVVSTATVAIALAVIACATALVAPGVLVVDLAVRPFAPALDRAQLWTCSAVLSATLVVSLRLALGHWQGAARAYAGICILAVAAIVVAKYGCHARWPDGLVNAFTQHFE